MWKFSLVVSCPQKILDCEEFWVLNFQIKDAQFVMLLIYVYARFTVKMQLSNVIKLSVQD